MAIYLTDPKRASRFISLALLYLFIINMVNGIPQLNGNVLTTASAAFKIIIGIYFISLLPMLFNNFSKSMLIFVLISLFVTLLNLLIFPDLDSFFIPTLEDFYTICFPTAITAMAINDIDYFKKCLVMNARIFSAISIVLLVGIVTGRITFYTNSYSMGFGYSMLTPVLLLIYELIAEKRNIVLDIISLVVMTICLLAYGSRGPIFAILLFLIFYLLRYFIESKNITAVVVVIIVSCILLFNLNNLFLSLGKLLGLLGFDSRTIDMITSTSLSETNRLSGRDNLWNALIQQIRENPFIVRGINAEWKVIGYYAHNMCIELIYQLGIIGMIFLVWVLYLICRELLNTHYTLGNEISIILMFSCIPGLMFSNSIWISSSFWIWLGISVGSWKQYDVNQEGYYNENAADRE